MKIIDIGCGNSKYPVAIGIDIRKQSQADIVWDLDMEPYPLPSNEFDLIICQDILEHLAHVDLVLNEIHRVSKPRAIIKIRTPHYTSRYAYNDPEHKHYFGIHAFDRFLQNDRVYKQDDAGFALVKRVISFPRLWRMLWLQALANKFADRYEQMFAYIFPAENMYFEFKVKK